jgi:hypothetical protein
LVASLPRNVSAEAWTLGAAPVRAVTFLRAPQGTQFLKFFYTLRLREREGAIGTKNMMQVAVWRNLSQVRAVCDLPPPLLSVETGEVLSCSGLGETAVAAATALHSPAETVRGEVGGLTSFVARALHPHVHSVQRMLADMKPSLQSCTRHTVCLECSATCSSRSFLTDSRRRRSSTCSRHCVRRCEWGANKESRKLFAFCVSQ